MAAAALQPAAQQELYGIPSPCVNGTDDDGVFWQPQPFSLAQNIDAVERALEIVVQQPLHAYYTTQFAGDMQARFADETADETMTLLQTRARMISSGCRRT